MPRTSKVSNWRTILNNHIEANKESIRHSFDRAEGFDCVRWTTECMFLTTGIRYPLMEKAKYKTDIGALAYLRRNGCETLQEIADKAWGERLPISFAGAGDPVLADLDRLGLTGGQPSRFGLAMGICNGWASYFVGDEGLIELPTLKLDFCYHG